jgi:hypothetical protein
MDATEIFTVLFEPAGKADPYPLYAALHQLGEAVAPMPCVVVVHGYDAVRPDDWPVRPGRRGDSRRRQQQRHWPRG